MADEKIFIIPLRKSVNKKPLYQRAKKAVTTIREYIRRHMKVKEVKVGPYLNSKIWERGSRHPPGKIKVKSIIEDGKALVELPEFEFVKKKEEKKETLKEKILGKKETKAEEHKVHETKDEQKLVEEGKVEEKHTKGEQKLQEKHPAEHKGESTEEVSKGKLKFKNTMPSKQKAGRFLKHEKAPKE